MSESKDGTIYLNDTAIRTIIEAAQEEDAGKTTVKDQPQVGANVSGGVKYKHSYLYYNEDGVPCFSKEHAERCLKGRSDYKKIVPVSEQVKADLAEVVKQDFISTNGKGIPEGSKRHDVVNKSLSTISAKECASASGQNRELVERYLTMKTVAKPNTLMNYKFVQNILKSETFNDKKISQVKTSDAKRFLIKFQQDGRYYSTAKTVRGVLRPAFQMTVDDDVLMKKPFGFGLAGVVVNDSVTREAITKDQMRKFLKFIHDDNVYCKYYEEV